MGKYTIRLQGCEYESCDVTMFVVDRPGHRDVVWSGTVDELVGMFDLPEIQGWSLEGMWEMAGTRLGTREQDGWVLTVFTG